MTTVSNTREVSPPPTKRRRVTGASSEAHDTSIPRGNHVAVFSWNVNGVGPLLQHQLSFEQRSEAPLRAFLRRQSWPQFLCLQEVKIRNSDEATQRKLGLAANSSKQSGEPQYTARFSLPRDKYNAIGFGGRVHGVATLIRDDILPSLTKLWLPEWDLEGRVQIMELSSRLAIINGYWPNGTENLYRDPSTGITIGTRHDHKLNFHRHMLKESLALQKRGFGVILIGDVNIARNTIDGHPNLRTSPSQHVKNRYDFNQKFFDAEDGFQGIDAFRELHGQQRKYTYHPRGIKWGSSCDRVDNALASRCLFPNARGPNNAEAPYTSADSRIIAADILDNPQDRGHSDHVPLYVVVETSNEKSS